MLLPLPHLRIAARDDHLAVEKVRRRLRIDRHPAILDLLHQRRDIGRLHVAVVPDRAPDAFADFIQLESTVLRHGRDFLGQDAQQHDCLVQAAIRLHMMQQRDRRARGRSDHEHPSARHAGDVLAPRDRREFAFRHVIAVHALKDRHAPDLPRVHDREDARADRQRKPSAFANLPTVGQEKARIDHQEKTAHRSCVHQRLMPAAPHHKKVRDGRDAHRARDRDAVRRRQIRSRPEKSHRRDRPQRQQCIDERQINLPRVFRVGVLHHEPREIPELDRLARQRIRPGNQRLARDHRRHDRQPGQQRPRRALRRQREERILVRLGVGEDECALPEIIQHQSGKRRAIPCDLDILAAEVPHVRVQRLGPRDRKHHCTEQRADLPRAVLEQHQTILGIERPQHTRMLVNLPDPQCPEHDEPDQHHRSEDIADVPCALVLKPKQHRKNSARQPGHVVRETRIDRNKTLGRSQHRNRRRDDPVAIQQRRADQDHDHRCPQAFLPGRFLAGLQQRQQRKDAALALVVRFGHEKQILHAHHQHQRPEDQRQHPVHPRDRLHASRQMRPAFVHGVQRAGADVAKHDAQCAQTEGKLRAG